MARIFITGSADGLGLMAAQLALEQGHEVVAHARNERRAEETRAKLRGAQDVLVGDLSSITQTRALAERVNELGTFDAVIHNAAVGDQESKRLETEDGLPHVFAINTLAPYILTALIARPKRLIYLSSGLHRGGDASLDDLLWERRRWNGTQAYSDSKFHDVLLVFGVARRWPSVFSNAVDPGWVATKMGGARAADDLNQGHRTQVWLAVSAEPAAKVSGQYFYHMRLREPNPATRDTSTQEKLVEACEKFSGVRLPSA